jgi:hypothetical protein
VTNLSAEEFEGGEPGLIWGYRKPGLKKLIVSPAFLRLLGQPPQVRYRLAPTVMSSLFARGGFGADFRRADFWLARGGHAGPANFRTSNAWALGITQAARC